MNKDNTVKVWDELSDEFNTYKKRLFFGAPDNICTLWPIFLNYIKKNFEKRKLRILDYGCGTGMFCRKLESLGHNPSGIDPAERMIYVARKHNKNIKFLVGNYREALEIQLRYLQTQKMRC